jgi:hypothetical protein
MAMSSKATTTTALIAALIASVAPPVQACCFDDNQVGFYLRFPAAPYAKSALHTVVTPDFAPRHLGLLYRTTSGVPIDALELKALERAWALTYNEVDSRSEALQAQAAWAQAAGKVLGMAAVSLADVIKDTPDASTYVPVHADAFRRAQQRLVLRQKRYAKAPAVLKAWTARQSELLGVGFAASTTMPVDVPADLAAFVAEDAAVFAALDAFYGGRYDDAVKAFDALTTGDDAPWAPINAARAHLRHATLASTSNEERDAHFAEAERRLRAVTSKDERVSSAAQSLLLLTLQKRNATCEALPQLMHKRLGDQLPHGL